MRYIQSFNTANDVQTAIDNGSLGKPYVAYIESDGVIDWNTTEKTDYSKMYLTFNIISGGTINWKASLTSYTTTISYSKDNGTTWTDITSNVGKSAPTINVNAGDKVLFKGNNAAYGGNDSQYNMFGGSALFEVEGNIMSLIDSNNFTTATTLTSARTFSNLFNECTGLTSAENLVLPATTLAERCYFNMFFGCRSLTTAPSLPATTLTNYCYGQMFYGCTSLTTAPVLPATTLTEMCYTDMFQDCNSLNYIKCLATNISAYKCTRDWVFGVDSTGTFVKNASMSGWSTGASGIPEGWTVIDA